MSQPVVSLKTIARSPSGRAITKPRLAMQVARQKEIKVHSFIPGGKLAIVNPRYLNNYLSAGFWLKFDSVYRAKDHLKNTLFLIDKNKGDEFFNVIASQLVRANMGLRLPEFLLDSLWLNRTESFRVQRFILMVLWLVIPLKNLKHRIKSVEYEPVAFNWLIISYGKSRFVNCLFFDLLSLISSQSKEPVEVCSSVLTLKSNEGKTLECRIDEGSAYQFVRVIDKQPYKTQLVLGLKDATVSWLGFEDGGNRAVIDLSLLYSLTDALSLDLVSQAHQKYILDALYKWPFRVSVNLQYLIELVTLMLVAQHYFKR